MADFDVGIPRGVVDEKNFIVFVPGEGEKVFPVDEIDLLFLETLEEPSGMPLDEDILYVVGKTLYIRRKTVTYVLAYASTKGTGKSIFRLMSGAEETVETRKAFRKIVKIR